MLPVPDRLLDAAERLVYARGIHGTGIDTILAEAGVAKMSLYKHFRSKDGLVAAMLERRDGRWMAWLEAGVVARVPDPAARLEALFDVLGTWFAQPDFHGCAFINAAGEEPDPAHPVRGIARRHKQLLKDYIARLVDAADLAPSLADGLFLLVEGAIVTALVDPNSRAAETAKATAALLITAHKGSRS